MSAAQRLLRSGRYTPAIVRIPPHRIVIPTSTAVIARMGEANRLWLIVRNCEAFDMQIASTAVANSNRNPATTGFIDLPTGQEYYIDASPTLQWWVRPKVSTDLNGYMEVEGEIRIA